MPRKHVDRCTAREKIFHHLPRHFLRVGRHACFRRAMISGANEDVRRVDAWLQRVLNAPELQRQRFKATQAAQRFGFLIDLVL